MEVTLNKGVATKRGLLENTILSWVKKKQSILPFDQSLYKRTLLGSDYELVDHVILNS